MPVLNWIGKESVVKHHKEVPFRLLEPVPELSCGDADSGNIIAEGDNLLALKALLPRYAGKVKCIYIDPPYNTGNEGWAYNDNVKSPEILKWLGEVVGREGETLDRHDRWLCMMYPRLLLLKQFLREDGVIAVSIDDVEIHHLRALMDEIFGVKRRLATMVWRTDGNFDNQAKIKNCHEYVLMYAINPERFEHPNVLDPSVGEGSKLNRPQIQNTIVKNGLKNPVSSVVLPKGFPSLVESALIPARTDSWPHYDRDAIVEDGKLVNEVTVSSGWSSKNLFLQFIEEDFSPIQDTKGQQTRFAISATGAIESIKERGQQSHVITVISGVGTTQSQSAELAGMGFTFPFPKPVEFVKYLISIVGGADSLILDSFAGSGTTGHAVLKQNAEDGGDRKFILVEMDEKIAEGVTAERVRRVTKGYIKANGDKVEGLGGGFQYCRLSEEPLFLADGRIRETVTFAELAEFVWFMETGAGGRQKEKGKRKNEDASAFLGTHNGKAVILLYNGILKDRSDIGGNVLNGRTLEFINTLLPDFDGERVIYAARTRFDKKKLAALGITFHQLPYDLATKTWF